MFSFFGAVISGLSREFVVVSPRSCMYSVEGLFHL